MMGVGVSTDGTSNWLVQLGDAGGIETSGYLSSCGSSGGTTDATAGFLINKSNVAAVVYRFQLILNLEDASDFTWVGSSQLGGAGEAAQFQIGSKATSQATTTIRLTTANGSDSFDAGFVNVNYIR